MPVFLISWISWRALEILFRQHHDPRDVSNTDHHHSVCFLDVLTQFDSIENWEKSQKDLIFSRRIRWSNEHYASRIYMAGILSSQHPIPLFWIYSKVRSTYMIVSIVHDHDIYSPKMLTSLYLKRSFFRLYNFPDHLLYNHGTWTYFCFCPAVPVFVLFLLWANLYKFFNFPQFFFRFPCQNRNWATGIFQTGQTGW